MRAFRACYSLMMDTAGVGATKNVERVYRMIECESLTTYSIVVHNVWAQCSLVEYGTLNSVLTCLHKKCTGMYFLLTKKNNTGIAPVRLHAILPRRYRDPARALAP